MTGTVPDHTPPATRTLGGRARHRLLCAVAITAAALWAAFSLPIASWVLGSTPSVSTDPGRIAAAYDVVTQGWWAVIAATIAAALGTAIVVGSRYLAGKDWTRTALAGALRLAAILLACWALWTICVLAAAGAQPR